MTQPSQQILAAGQSSLPLSYTVPNTQDLEPLSVNATFDGTAAAGSFVPTVEIVSDGGVVIARVPCLTTVAAGAEAEVTFAPFLRGAAAAAATGGGGFSGGATGTITGVGSGTGRTTSANSVTSVNALATKPTGVAAGDLLVVLVNSYFPSGPFGNLSLPATPTGWKAIYSYDLVAQTDGGAAGFKTARAAFWRVADGTEGSTLGPWVIVSDRTADISGFVLCRAYRGVNTVTTGSFYVNQTSVTGAAPYSPVAPSVPGVIYNSVSLLAVTFPAAVTSGTWTDPSGYSTVASQTNVGGTVNTLFAEQNPVSSGPAQTFTFSGSSSLSSAHRFLELAQIIIYPAVS